VGLKSFSYTHDSSNPANLKTIKATLILHFQDFESLVAEFPATGTGKCSKMSYFDLLRYANFCEDIGGVPQNIVEPPIKEKDKSPFPRDTSYFRIRAFIGHRGLHQTMKDIPDGTKVLTAAEMSGYTLFLEMVNQQIKFNQDGSLDLTVEFQGAIERAFNSRDMNVLSKGRAKQIEGGVSDSEKLNTEKKARDKEIKKLKAERDKIVMAEANWKVSLLCAKAVQGDPDAMDGACVDAAEGSIANRRAEEFKWDGRPLQLKREERKQLTAIDVELVKLSGDSIRSITRSAKRVSYDGFIEAFFNILIKNQRLFVVDVPAKYIMKTSAPLQTVFPALHTQRAAPSPRGNAAISATRIASSKEGDTLQTRKGQILDVQSKGTTTDMLATARVKKKGAFRIAAAVDAKDNARIQFFFFGDLLDAAISILKEEGMFKSDMLVASGPLIYSDVRSSTGAYKSINLADVPVSLNLFTRWWVEEVVFPAKRIFSLQAFIASAVDELIIEALGSNCVAVLGKEFHNLQGKTKVKMANLTLKKSAAESVLKPGSRVKIRALRDKIKPIPAHITGKSLTQVLFIYSENLQAEIPRKKQDKDEKERGIFHLFLGKDRGLVKKMNFSALEQAYGKEAKAESNDELNANALPTRYKCEVVLVGTAAFQPGALIYLKPWPRMGTNLARALNLEGYYSINTVEGVLENGKFETTLNTVWQSSGTGQEAVAGGALGAKKLKGQQTEVEWERENRIKQAREVEILRTKILTDRQAEVEGIVKLGKFPHTGKLTVPQGWSLEGREKGEIELAYRDRYKAIKNGKDFHRLSMIDIMVLETLQKDLDAHKWGSKHEVKDPTPPDITDAGLSKNQQKDFNEKYKAHYKALQKEHYEKADNHEWLDSKAVALALAEMGSEQPDVTKPPEVPKEPEAPPKKNIVPPPKKEPTPAPTGVEGELVQIPANTSYGWTLDSWKPQPLMALESHLPLNDDELKNIHEALINAEIAGSDTPTPDVQKMLEDGELTVEKEK